ncbi:hypothetical protein HK405_000873 [Cladochytrium tenue]|nr:hypothetical protein HK405_000873 [Cladochytrium tenue]
MSAANAHDVELKRHLVVFESHFGLTENSNSERCAAATATTVEADGINGIRASIRLLRKASPSPVPLPPPDLAITPPPPTVPERMDRIIDMWRVAACQVVKA